MPSFLRLIFLFVFTSIASSFSLAYAAPRIAVWNPEKGTTETRFKLSPAELDQTASWLSDAGIKVERLNTAQINQPEVLTTKRFDALFLPGITFPAANLEALRSFAAQGGILVALHTAVPFLIAIETNPDGTWTMAPKTPTFAWQKTDIMDFYGLKYSFKPELHDLGVLHQPTPVLKKYLPTATTIQGQLPGRWIYPAGDAQLYPLLRSTRANGDDVTPQTYIAKKGNHTALVVSEGFTNGGMQGWPAPREVVVALARIAADLQSGQLQLDPATHIASLEKLTLPGPLQGRLATATVVPKGTKPLANWGHFNGSSLDLSATAEPNKLTRVLAPGASLTLSLPGVQMPQQPVFLRVRGAFLATGAGLKLEMSGPMGQRPLWNELFTYIDSRSAGNFNAGLAGFPTEFTRLMFVPPDSKLQTLTVSNPGRQPIYFDALQLETRTQPSPERIMGLGGASKTIPRETSQSWTNVRINPRPQFIGPPGDPKRWDKVDANMQLAAASNQRIQIVLEGTPAWAAISPERLQEGELAKRPHTVPPDTQKYATLLEEFIGRYGDKVDSYEIWNEPDIQQFWRGTHDEYTALYNALVPVVRRLDPTATVITAGMSGFNDPWVQALVKAEIPAKADLFAFHPYAGKSAGWDTVYGLVQGSLKSRGQDIEIYCDESGFVSQNAEWFQAPPVWTPAVQARYLDVAMARLLATDMAKLNIFNAGGDGNPYGLFDRSGQSLPAYSVFADYLPLGQNGGRRLDISLTSPDGSPLQGVYSAAASHSDGSATILVNPAEAEALQPAVNPSSEFNNADGWTVFFGKTERKDDLLVVTPEAGKAYAGFYTSVSLDPAKFPLMEVNLPQSEGGYDLIFKLPGGRQLPIVTKGAVGVWRGDLRKLLPEGTREFEVSFRVYGSTSFDYLRFTSDGAPVASPTLPVRLFVPLAKTTPYSVIAQSNGQAVPIKSQFFTFGAQRWAELTFAVPARTQVRLKPQK